MRSLIQCAGLAGLMACGGMDGGDPPAKLTATADEFRPGGSVRLLLENQAVGYLTFNECSTTLACSGAGGFIQISDTTLDVDIPCAQLLDSLRPDGTFSWSVEVPDDAPEGTCRYAVAVEAWGDETAVFSDVFEMRPATSSPVRESDPEAEAKRITGPAAPQRELD